MPKLTFEQAYTRLREIHDMLQTSEVIDVEKIIALQKEAKGLYEHLDQVLKKVEEDKDESSV